MYISGIILIKEFTKGFTKQIRITPSIPNKQEKGKHILPFILNFIYE